LAVARPMPLLPPVTTAILFFNEDILLLKAATNPHRPEIRRRL
jgi:hypothetical protein